jgi:hypothetical protein
MDALEQRIAKLEAQSQPLGRSVRAGCTPRKTIVTAGSRMSERVRALERVEVRDRVSK